MINAMRVLLVLIPLALAGCKAERQQLGQALSGKPPVVTGSLIGRWTIADLNGGGPVARGELAFTADSLAGTAGCNRLAGGWRQDGASLSIGPLAGTRMACAAAVMAVEARVIALLNAAKRVEFDARGGATLISGDGQRLRLIPALPEPPRS
jgi:heat shock protein HslJ